MPLPTTDTAWPPTDPAIQTALADWSAWYSADPDRLYERYANRAVRELPENRPSQFRGGIWGRIARWFWGQPIPPGEKRARLHVPLAGDIARTSSDLLFSEPPTLTPAEGASKATSQRYEQLMPALHPTLLEAAELCAALGGVYLRVVWDDSVSDRPWLDAAPADGAAPEFRYGRLSAVTFWTVLHIEGHRVWRHLERHEKGRIYHGLYEGTPGMLGHARPLAERPETAPLARMVDAQGGIDTGAPNRLTAVYVPNVRPARAWTHIPAARGWGQSDFQGIEPLLDALDETYSSWMRDVRLAKGRVIVPRSMLESGKPGEGAVWNPDREIYADLNMLPRAGDSGQLTIVQFDIRVQEHRETCAELIEQAVRQAGYSGATFGVGQDGQGVTATEIRARERRSMTTRARKSLYWKPALADAIAALLAVEAGRFGVRGLSLEPPHVEFADSIQDSPQELAQVALTLMQAEAASAETRVRIVHPDWDDAQVTAEVQAILEQTGANAAPDPGGTYPLTERQDAEEDEPAAA